jgi:hypothetical protein
MKVPIYHQYINHNTQHIYYSDQSLMPLSTIEDNSGSQEQTKSNNNLSMRPTQATMHRIRRISTRKWSDIQL